MDWKPIERWQDMEEFASRLVAFTLGNRSVYIDSSASRGRDGDCFQFPDSPGVRYGFVSADFSIWRMMFGATGDDRGYKLTRIKYPDGCSSNCALIDYHVAPADMRVRLLTEGERARLKAAIDSGMAQLEYTDWEFQTRWEKR